MNRPLVYLAGPGVFRADAKEYGHALKRQAASFGLAGLWPLDNSSLPEKTTKIVHAHRICNWNKSLIERCDGVVADISPFRGPNMDPGTAWEIGFADAIGKSVFAYSSDLRDLLERTLLAPTIGHDGPRDGEYRDGEEMLIENFGLPENLMISCSVQGIYDSAGKAMLAAADFLIGGLTDANAAKAASDQYSEALDRAEKAARR